MIEKPIGDFGPPPPWEMNPRFEAILKELPQDKLIELIIIMGEHNLDVYKLMEKTAKKIGEIIDPKQQ
ncbi:MAG: hypothetical protein KAR16_13070 [Bacteroidales bacterium]|nr:hypothetical protein [Bacteroidales bacterium]